MKFIKVLCINLLVLAILTELISILYISIRKPYLRKFELVPTYLDFSFQDEFIEVDPASLNPRIIDSTLPWGIWHVPNKSSRHRTNCFDVTMEFNRFGARGPIPDLNNAENVIFLGDSFTEGFGLAEDETIPAQVTRISGKPSINLGVSRSGTTQQSLLYHHFADSFKHSRVVMLIHLENDLTDNDYNRHDTVTRYYKPYRKDDSRLELISYRGHPDSSSMNSRVFQQQIGQFQRILVRHGLFSHMQSDNYTVWGRMARLTYSRRIWEIFLNYQESKIQQDKLPPIFNWQERDLNILSYDMRSVMKEAAKHDARVTFINLPGQQLLNRLHQHPENRKDYLMMEQRLRKVADQNGHQFRSYFEYLEARHPEPGQIFFTCDGHYNPYGAKMVAEFLSTAMEPTVSKPDMLSARQGEKINKNFSAGQSGSSIN